MNQILEKNIIKPVTSPMLNMRREIKVFSMFRNNKYKGMTLQKALLISFVFHPVAIILIFTIVQILGLDKMVSTIAKKEVNPVDIEFIFAKQPEKEPINKKTKFRSDKNLRAGGKQNPVKEVSAPLITHKPNTVMKKNPDSNKIKENTRIPQKIVEKIAEKPSSDETAKLTVKTPDSSENAGTQNNTGKNNEMSLSGESKNFNPASGDNSTPGVDAIKTVDFNPYILELQRRIKREWQPPRGEQSRKAVLVFQIDKKGKLLSVKVHKSSGNPSADRAALFAVQRAQPFMPLPHDFNNNYVNIVFAFDSKVFNLNGSQRI